MKYLITSLHLFLVLLTACKGQTNYSAQTLEKIREVENNVTGNLILNDEPPSTILERMQKYNVKGVSIAVIEDYKVVWAKGYGWADSAPVRHDLCGVLCLSFGLHGLGRVHYRSCNRIV